MKKFISSCPKEVYYSTFTTRFGSCLVASTDEAVCNVLFFDHLEEGILDLRSRWPGVKLVSKVDSKQKEVREYFKGNFPRSKIRFSLYGTDFQKKVWQILLHIPEGEVWTYGQVAKIIGDKNLSRAVGSAIGSNPIGYIIPCHRVVRTDGKDSGYRWGIERKKKILDFESINHSN